jgi:hypothetical protein
MQLLWTLWILGTAALAATAWTVRALHRVSQALPASNADFGFDTDDIDLWSLRA